MRELQTVLTFENEITVVCIPNQWILGILWEIFSQDGLDHSILML